MDVLSALLSPASGPFWGLLGVAVTQIANLYMNRKKLDLDGSAAAMKSINDGHQSLVSSCFQMIRQLNEQVSALREHTEDCERRHTEASKRLAALEVSMARKGLPEGDEAKPSLD